MTVPWILNRVYDGIQAKLKQGNFLAKKLFEIALEAKLYNYWNFGVLKHPIWDRLVFSKVWKVLGGEIKQMCVGGAPMDKNILEFLRVVFSVPIIEGYG